MSWMAVKGSLQWVLWQNKSLQLCSHPFSYACMNTFRWSFHISPTGFHYLGVHISNSFKSLHKENIAKLMDPNKVDIQCCNNLPLLLVEEEWQEWTSYHESHFYFRPFPFSPKSLSYLKPLYLCISRLVNHHVYIR